MDAELSPMPLVLMYHSVEDYESDPYQVTVRPHRLDQQLRWLRRRGLRGVSMIELLEARREGRGAGLIGLTFDDGYTDFRTEVMPALEKHGCTATVFIVAGSLGGHNAWDVPGPRKALLTAAEILGVVVAGIEIGSHSLDHVHLPKAGDGDLYDQVRRSRLILTEITGRAVTGFCYPYGSAGQREVAAVEDAGYDYACSVRSSALDGRYAIPRAFIGDKDNGPRLLAKIARYRLTVGRVVR